MRTELPVCKRCCFCVPLRYGLLTWGYLKLIAAIIVSIALIISLVNFIELLITYKPNPYLINQVVVLSIVLVILLTDVVLNILFVIGGHTKNVKFLRVYYIYNIVLWALTVALGLFMFCVMVHAVLPDRVHSYRAWLLLLDFSSLFVNIAIQSYFLLLLRSEIIKLRNNCEFRFVNNAAEAACTMKFEEGIVDVEKGTEDVSENGTWTCETDDSCEKSCQCKGTCHRNIDKN